MFAGMSGFDDDTSFVFIYRFRSGFSGFSAIKLFRVSNSTETSMWTKKLTALEVTDKAKYWKFVFSCSNRLHFVWSMVHIIWSKILTSYFEQAKIRISWKVRAPEYSNTEIKFTDVLSLRNTILERPKETDFSFPRWKTPGSVSTPAKKLSSF